MPKLILRDLDSLTLSRIRAIAISRKVSVDRLIVDSLQRLFSEKQSLEGDLDTLVGSWTGAEATAFDAAIAPFSQIDASLWVEDTR